MTITLKMDHPDFPDETEFGVSTLGRVKNHGTLELDDDVVAALEVEQGMTLADMFKDNPLVTVSGSNLTPVKAEKSKVPVHEVLQAKEGEQ